MQARIIPWVFVAPALTLLGIYLVYSTGVTIWESIVGDKGFSDNYGQILKPDGLAAIRNNIIWLVLGTGGSVGLGLVIAAMFDRVRREALAKTFVFLPLAISLVGASVIWRFVYEWRPANQPQYGLLNAVWTSFGGQPINWVATPPINTYLLVLIMVWLQTGFAMVVLSAAIKGVSTEVMEAARMDGANERQLFLKVVVPIIKGSIITVATTVAIVVLKVFDIVYVMTGGRYRHGRGRRPDVPGEVPVLRGWPRGRPGGGALRGRAADHVHQPAQPAPARSRQVTATSTVKPAKSVASVRAWRPMMLQSLPLQVGVVVICLLWTAAHLRPAGHVRPRPHATSP